MATVEFRVARAAAHRRRRRRVPRLHDARRASWPARPTCSCRRPTAASSSTTSSASSAARATWSATRGGASLDTTPRAATASCSGGREPCASPPACKWLDRRPEVDPLTGAVHDDQRSAGASDADQAALERALRRRRGVGRRGGRGDAPGRRRRRPCCATCSPRARPGPSGSTSPPATPSQRRRRPPAGAPRWPAATSCGAATHSSTGAAARCPPSSPPTSVPRRPSGWSASSSARRPVRCWPSAGSTAAAASGCASARRRSARSRARGAPAAGAARRRPGRPHRATIDGVRARPRHGTRALSGRGHARPYRPAGRGRSWRHRAGRCPRASGIARPLTGAGHARPRDGRPVVRSSPPRLAERILAPLHGPGATWTG